MALAMVLLASAPLRADDKAGLEFFEQKIRPVLVTHCNQCHSPQAKSPKGNLRVDGRAALLKGGDSGPAIVPGKPAESPLLKAMREDEFALMPPKGKLPDAVVADFERWIKMGAPDPRDGDTAPAAAGIDVAKGREYWAFRPLHAAPAPAVQDAAWPRTDIDRHLLAALEAKHLKPAADATKAQLLRRLTYDLAGLPPTPAEVAAFEADLSPDALATVVDRLIAAPTFGERWGRRWLDVARYADSNGKDENLTFHDAWRYRDYVVAAFNADKPFVRFVREQIAGDLLPFETPGQRDEQLTGTGFLCIGPKVLADRDHERRRMDVVDEQIDTVGRTFLGLTLGCARCHDHKFDPVPTRDYYALAGIFNSTRTLDSFKLGNPIVSGWTVRPLGGADGERRLAAVTEHKAKLAKLTKEVAKARETFKAADDKAMMRVPTKLVGVVVDDPQAKVEGAWKPSKYTQPYVGDGYLTDSREGKGTKRITWTPTLAAAGEYEVQLSYTAGGNRAKAVPITVVHAGGTATATLDQTKPPTHDGLFASVGTFKFAAGTGGSVTLSTAGTDGFVLADAARFVPTGAFEKDAEMAMGVPAETRTAKADAEAKLKKLEAEAAALKAAAPEAPDLVLAVRDDTCGDCKVNVRGNPHQLGAEVPRGFLSVVGNSSPPSIPTGQSGRRELADWLADPANPLPARVYVNRVWLHLFGEGLVRSVDNFGVQGDRPTHPELLDALAAKFVAEGGSTKKLVRELVSSRAYGLSTTCEPSLAVADPANKLLGRAHRRRLDAEAIRDGILAVAGTLDRTMGGSAVGKLGERAIDNDSKGGGISEASVRRSLYLPILRNDLPQLLEAFDFADPDVATGKRDATTVPTQALYLMNSPFAQAQAKAAAAKLLALPDDAARVATLYREAFARPPTADETARAVTFVAAAKTPEAGWARVCQAVFGCTEFRFLD